ncbi:MAG: ABC transporter ATP-binding protein [Burkholderiales bacterium]|nr:ABC transporter ATP-binding protein [Phycisphaerae bacterium]
MTAVIRKIFSRKPAAAPANLPQTDEEARYRPIEWPMVKKVFSAMKPYRRTYILGIVICWAHVVLDMLGPQVIGTIINFLGDYIGDTQRTQSAGFIEWLFRKVTGAYAPAELTPTRAIIDLAILVWVIWGTAIAVSILLQRWTILTMTRAGESVQFDFRRKIFAKLQQLDMSFYDKTKLGRIISRCTSDIGGMREVNVWGIAHIFVQTSMMVIAGIMLAYTDLRLFFAVAWIAPVLYCINRFFLKRVAVSAQVVREGFTRISTNLAENINGMRVVTAFNRQDPNLQTFNRLQIDNTDNNLKQARLNGTYQPTLEIVRVVGRWIIVVYGGYLVASGQMAQKGVGCVVQAYLYWDWFMNPILVLGNFYNQLMVAMAGAERVFSLLETSPQVQDVPDAKPLPRISGRVTFENVTFGYKPDRPVLHDVNFEAAPGQMFALVGHTGSGKSSIISLIARFYQPQSGRVLVDGHDIRLINGDSLHKQMGLVLQVNYLFTGTVLDNIRYAKPDATEQDVIRAATDLGTYDAIMNLNDGLQTDVGERGANMSLGQRQLICFTRAYLADPRIFMLDEATSAVDTATELVVQNSLEKLLKGRTTFVVAHRLSTIMRADRILVIDQGQIIEQGTHAELLAANGRYAHLYEQFVAAAE